jgi:hypothetical protein
VEGLEKNLMAPLVWIGQENFNFFLYLQGSIMPKHISSIELSHECILLLCLHEFYLPTSTWMDLCRKTCLSGIEKHEVGPYPLSLHLAVYVFPSPRESYLDCMD